MFGCVVEIGGCTAAIQVGDNCFDLSFHLLISLPLFYIEEQEWLWELLNNSVEVDPLTGERKIRLKLGDGTVIPFNCFVGVYNLGLSRMNGLVKKALNPE